MRKVVALILFVAGAYVALNRAYTPPPSVVTQPQRATTARLPAPDEAHGAAPPTSEDDPSLAIQRHARDVHVDGSGMVVSVLRDDNDGERHQRILVRLPRGETVLIVHNIDIAPRVDDLRPGDTVQFDGEYVWNDKGGLVHWTHRDPSGRHRTGYLLVRGRKYQ